MSMTDEQRRAYAEDLILEHARDVEYLTIHEAAEDSDHVPGGEISDEDAGKVADLIRKATVNVEWSVDGQTRAEVDSNDDW